MACHGIYLLDSVLKKIYRENAEKIIPKTNEDVFHISFLKIIMCCEDWKVKHC